MCGIIGVTGVSDAARVLLQGLQRLEYRGYDSAGIVVNHGEGFRCAKAPGKIARLAERLQKTPLNGNFGLGHTRWATHGPPTERNAHPHFSCDRRITVVHNGIIENYAALRKELTRAGHKFTTQTDTETLVHLIEKFYKGDPLQAVARALKRVHGTYALGALFADHPQTLIAARLNSPLVVGLASGKNLIASDISALIVHTNRVVALGEEEIVRVRPTSVEVFDRDLRPRPLQTLKIDWTPEAAEKGGYPHYMLKEIFEQPQVAEEEIAGRLRGNDVVFEDLSPALWKRVKRIVVVACGTAWHSGVVAKYALEELARVPTEANIASELRYGDPCLDRSTLVIAISQSGETQDTLAATRIARHAGARVLAITNIRGSTLSREADEVIHMRAGLEVGVAATKTYTSQLLNVLLLSIAAGRARGTLTSARAGRLLKDARRLPALLTRILGQSEKIRISGEKYRHGHDFMYIGRRYNLATALEGALKMKEISYLHAEGYGGGEMKHGPLALVDENRLSVAVAVQGRVREKMLSNIEEIRARKGKVIGIATEGDAQVASLSEEVFPIPACEEMFSPVLAVVPLQLFAYHTAAASGRDVDQPRNLAKSVTVE